MARNTYPWFKFYSEFLHDPKIRRLSIEERYVWVGLLCLAAESPIRGELWLTKKEPLGFMDIAISLDMKIDDVRLEKALENFERLEMITRDGSPKTTKIINWKDRQGSDSPDAVRERVALYREKRDVTDKPVTRNGNVTDRVDKDKDKDKEKRESRPDASIDFLRNVTEEVKEEFATTFKCSKDQVRMVAASLADYCEGHGKKYRNYKAMLRNALRKQYGEISEEDKRKNAELRERIKLTFQSKKV